MRIQCVWEHNGDDTLLYAANLPGAYARGENLEIALEKMQSEVNAYLLWRDGSTEDQVDLSIAQDVACDLQVCDADSDVLFKTEKTPLTKAEYAALKALALKSAADFQRLYESISDKTRSDLPIRNTFYGKVPRSAEEMYQHTKNVNSYYFGEIDIDVDNDGTILECRQRGFTRLEQNADFLKNPVIEGSYGELWTVRKVLRRFIWHDRIHAKAMYRMAARTFGKDSVTDTFFFEKIAK